jgi:hypothetical protein
VNVSIYNIIFHMTWLLVQPTDIHLQKIQHGINTMYYGRRVKVKSLLSGEVPQPEEFKYLYDSLEFFSGGIYPSPLYPKEGLFPSSSRTTGNGGGEESSESSSDLLLLPASTDSGNPLLIDGTSSSASGASGGIDDGDVPVATNPTKPEASTSTASSWFGLNFLSG